MRKIVVLTIALSFVLTPLAFSFGQYADLSDKEVAKLIHSPSVPTAIAAIRDAGMQNRRAFIPELMKLIYADNREIRTAAIWSLGVMGADEAVDDLAIILWSDSRETTFWDKTSAAFALGSIPSADPWILIDVLYFHPDLKLALVAGKALEKRPEKVAKVAVWPFGQLLNIKQ